MATKRLAYLDLPAKDAAKALGLPAGAEVVGVGWENDTLLIQVRSDAVPARTAKVDDDADADHHAEHVELKAGVFKKK